MAGDDVSLSKRDREIAAQYFAGCSPKEIAAFLEIGLSTVNEHLSEICRRAEVNRPQLFRWMLQNPRCLEKGALTPPGLHVPQCPCGSPGCLGGIALTLDEV